MFSKTLLIALVASVALNVSAIRLPITRSTFTAAAVGELDARSAAIQASAATAATAANQASAATAATAANQASAATAANQASAATAASAASAATQATAATQALEAVIAELDGRAAASAAVLLGAELDA
ncbi:hypothetical protein VKT23_019140 [Stygiomarasmius scandens]|uniref:Antifreeze protein n=1 Tax=Marasmiellus scandens TaxID=2682957 RepID=A0ABR1IPJ0_9AGAR